MDRRQQKTINAVIEAFCGLLKEKNYDKITVQEIIDGANIGRSTFYSHFETKDFLLTKISDDLFEHIFTSTFEDAGVSSDYEERKKEIIEHVLYHIKYDNKEIIGILINQGNKIFSSSFEKYFYALLNQYWFDKKNDVQMDIPIEIVMNHLYCSFIGIIQIWINNNYEMPIDEVSDYYLRLI